MVNSFANQGQKQIDFRYKKSLGFWGRTFMFWFRSPVNKFVKGVITSAYERGYLNSGQMHEIAAIVDRRLYPEYSKNEKR